MQTKTRTHRGDDEVEVSSVTQGLLCPAQRASQSLSFSSSFFERNGDKYMKKLSRCNLIQLDCKSCLSLLGCLKWLDLITVLMKHNAVTDVISLIAADAWQ